MIHLKYTDGQLRTETDPERIATLIRKGWVETPKPTHDPATQTEAEWVDGAWSVRDLTPDEIAEREAEAARKTWPTVTQFWNEFSDAEQYGIEVSTDPEIIVLRAKLKLWLSDVWSDDPRIVYALNKLVTIDILTEERRAVILQK
jgi:hypothetical protein